MFYVFVDCVCHVLRCLLHVPCGYVAEHIGLTDRTSVAVSGLTARRSARQKPEYKAAIGAVVLVKAVVCSDTRSAVAAYLTGLQLLLPDEVVLCTCSAFAQDGDVTAEKRFIDRVLDGAVGFARVVLDVRLGILADFAACLFEHLADGTFDAGVEAGVCAQQVLEPCLVLHQS